ncbi:hypothetical protein GCM10017581_038480 [Dactylosporangium matsuzakiense]|uniref:Uncharacterized protein n=1 Tax=Dactylosporangium matsuzakiense TaxID=53360 RepID=A0A9W6KKT8_9ACTN|nr:hypothetical protein GCM10017581_038480 [Dactylosporangium matsuzakiense]
MLLARAEPAVWSAIDEVQVSVYPGHEPSKDEISHWLERAMQHGVEVRLRPMSKFMESYSEQGTDDPVLVRRIYDTCLVAHVWRCYNVADGRFYKCPQAHFLPKFLNTRADDGIVIADDDSFGAALLAYLNADVPLESCRNCLGAVGKFFPHEEIRGVQWRDPQRVPTEDLVDWEQLVKLENTQYVYSLIMRDRRAADAEAVVRLDRS